MDIDYKDMDFARLLVKRYRNYDLDELDCMVLLVSDCVLRIEKTLLTCNILSSYMKAKESEIDSSLSKLIQKKFVEIVHDGNEIVTSIEGFKKKLFDDLIKDMTLERSRPSREGETNIYEVLEKLQGRMLSAIDRDMVTSWLRSGASADMVKEACTRTLTKSGTISFKRADTLLQDLMRSEGRKAIGVSTLDEETRNKEEIRDIIRNTDWTLK